LAGSPSNMAGLQRAVEPPDKSNTTSLLRKRLMINFLRIFTTGMIAIPGGFIFDCLRIPLPWMLGPLTITLLYNAARKRALWLIQLRNAGLIVIGYSMGRTVTVETAELILANLPAMTAVTLFTVLFCAGMGYVTHRRTGISLASGILGSMPGGLGQMVLLCEEIADADVTVVTFMQMSRVLTVVFIVPFIATYGMAHQPGGPLALANGGTVAYSLAIILPALLIAPVGAWLATWLKLPIPFLLGPIFATAIAVLFGSPAPPVPRPLMHMAQLFFGIYMGIIITIDSLRRLGKVFPYAIGGSMALVAFTYLLGSVLTLITPANLLTTFLSTAPGGLTEMGIVALSLNADVTFVLAYHLFRLFSILLVVPPLLRWRFKR
jgi:membrane AbrB-like protein